VYFYSAAMVASLLLLGWMGFLRLRMFYGPNKVNKLAFKPLNWAAFALGCKFIGQVLTLMFAPA
jgi:hypothetical protein